MKWLILCFIVTLAGCTTSGPHRPPEGSAPAARTGSAPAESGAVDYGALQRSLGLDRSTDELGYEEKPFNTCDAGYGYSQSHNCHREVFVVLHFRLVCRDSEGTISTVLTEMDVAPLAGRTVRWNLKGMSGTVVTDGLGYGQIRVVSPVSQKRERVRLAVGNEFLYMRAGEVTKIITPRPWCDPI